MTANNSLKMIIMRGISGSGKSTVVENIVRENKLNYIDHVFSADNFFTPKTLDFIYKENKDDFWYDLSQIWYKSPYHPIKNEKLFSEFMTLVNENNLEKARALALENISIFKILEYRKNWDFNKLGYAHKRNFINLETAVSKCINPVIVDNQNINTRDMRPLVELALVHQYEIEIRYPNSSLWKEYSPYLEDKYKYKKELSDFANLLYNNGLHGTPLDTISKNIAKWDCKITEKSLIDHVKKYQKE